MEVDFREWYTQVHGYNPFPWQSQLATLISNDSLPTSISVPTGCGKTAVIAVWHWATLKGFKVPTRLIYIVDRRLIVDSVTNYAEKLGCGIVKMRGGITIDDSWMMKPTEPTVIVSTVDQVGSRLLWRGYGVSDKAAPIHAALVGNDALIVLDEAHISTPFANTLETVKRLRHNSELPWHVITMSATPATQEDSLSLSTKDYKYAVLKKRLRSQKLARLVKATKSGFVRKVVSEAETLQEELNGVVGVICNTTRTAREVFTRLSGRKIVLTGRVRPFDKDRILADYLPQILSGSRENREPLFVVATQTIEVGADLDFDGLITQNAPIDALQQRFGRLNRLGQLTTSHAVIIHEDLAKNEECFVYGKGLLKKTWSWLSKAQEGRGQLKRVDFGIIKMAQTIKDTPPPTRESDTSRPLTIEDIRKLRQTLPQVPVDIEPWLHGENADKATVQVVWREDLLSDNRLWVETVSAAPPVLAEAMPCPVYDVRKWLSGQPVVTRDAVIDGKNIRPGDLIIVPSTYGGYDKWGWNPESTSLVPDVGNEAGSTIRLIGAEENADVDALLDDIGTPVKQPIAIPYPAGLIVTPANPRINGKEVPLTSHLEGTGRIAESLVKDKAVYDAARFHDIGKQDARFQVMLGAKSVPLAKSGHASSWAAQQAHQWSTLPKGWRHEVMSVAMLPEDTSDIVRYLVGTHHGHARAILPIGGDVSLWTRAGGPRWGNMTERLNDEYGSWGLAYLEALVRLSDWIQSKQEQENAICNERTE